MWLRTTSCGCWATGKGQAKRSLFYSELSVLEEDDEVPLELLVVRLYVHTGDRRPLFSMVHHFPSVVMHLWNEAMTNIPLLGMSLHVRPHVPTGETQLLCNTYNF